MKLTFLRRMIAISQTLFGLSLATNSCILSTLSMFSCDNDLVLAVHTDLELVDVLLNGGLAEGHRTQGDVCGYAEIL